MSGVCSAVSRGTVGNEVPNLGDIADGTSNDESGNGIPDEYE